MKGDTTQANMGRRQMPRCSTATCRLRVDAVGDEFCRLCRRFAGDRSVQVHGAEPLDGPGVDDADEQQYRFHADAIKAHGAQPTTLATFDVLAYLDEEVVCRIEAFRQAIAEDTNPTPKKRKYWSQQLSGAVGALITIQSALK